MKLNISKRNKKKNILIAIVLFIIIIIFIFCAFELPFGQLSKKSYLHINEFISSNSSGIMDFDQDYSDWVELHNSGEEIIELEGYYLSDSEKNPQKWSFPQLSVEPGEHALIFASGKDTVYPNGEIHTNFRLKKEGEIIILSNSDGDVIDKIESVAVKQNISYGRTNDGNKAWTYFYKSTPGLPNKDGIAHAQINFSHKGGFYEDKFNLSITSDMRDIDIFYTLDGSLPMPGNINSQNKYRKTFLYEDEIEIAEKENQPYLFAGIPTTELVYKWMIEWNPPNGNIFMGTVIRVASYTKEGKPTGEVITHTYFIDKAIKTRYGSLPVISLTSDYDNLFDPQTGIYVPGENPSEITDQNFFENWEKPAHIEFYEPGGSLGFSGDFKIRIQGSSSNANPLKGLHVIADKEFGDSKIEYRLFENTESEASKLTEFKRFIVRGWGSALGGNPTWSVFFSDTYHQTLFASTDLDIQDYRPVIVFINGEYWGLQELREANKNSWYHEQRTGIDRKDPGYDLIDGGSKVVDEGDSEHWENLIKYVRNSDMTVKSK